MKTRNSAGVGAKVDLDWNVNSLRITNSTQISDPSVMTGSNILAHIKSGKNANATTIVSNVTDNKQGSLQSLLASIKKDA
jgi:hypothetical protein